MGIDSLVTHQLCNALPRCDCQKSSLIHFGDCVKTLAVHTGSMARGCKHWALQEDTPGMQVALPFQRLSKQGFG